MITGKRHQFQTRCVQGGRGVTSLPLSFQVLSKAGCVWERQHRAPPGREWSVLLLCRSSPFACLTPSSPMTFSSISKEGNSFLFFKRFYKFIFRERGREKERKRNINQLPFATGDPVCNPGMCPDWESNWRPFGLQAGTQSTETHQPGLRKVTLNSVLQPQTSPRIPDLCISIPNYLADISRRHLKSGQRELFLTPDICFTPTA